MLSNLRIGVSAITYTEMPSGPNGMAIVGYAIAVGAVLVKIM